MFWLMFNLSFRLKGEGEEEGKGKGRGKGEPDTNAIQNLFRPL